MPISLWKERIKLKVRRWGVSAGFGRDDMGEVSLKQPYLQSGRARIDRDPSYVKRGSTLGVGPRGSYLGDDGTRRELRRWRRRVSITVLCLDNAIITAFHHTPRSKLASNEVTITVYSPASKRCCAGEEWRREGGRNSGVERRRRRPRPQQQGEDQAEIRNPGCRGNVRGQTEPQWNRMAAYSAVP